MTETTARTVLDGIKERAAIRPESFNFIQQAAHENQLLKVDLPRLTNALEAVLELADKYDYEAGKLDVKAERFIPGEVQSRYQGYAADARMKASLIRTAVESSLTKEKP
jgi:hypothetical protein